MKVFHAPRHAGHSPSSFYFWGQFLPVTPDPPARADQILRWLRAAGHTILEAPDRDDREIAEVHSPEYLDYLRTVWRSWQSAGRSQLDPTPFEPGPDVYPLVHPVGGTRARYPSSIVARAGYHSADLWLPIGEKTWEAARASANLAIAAAEAVLDGDRAAYGLCRPSGHHAYPDKGGGNCYLNNAAIAVQRLRRGMQKVAIVDIDMHHGNGTQAIFYGRADVLYVSLHCDPDDCYPYFVGYDDECGEGRGLGCNLNLPLPKFSGDQSYLAALDVACDHVTAFAPDALVISLGVDAHEADMNAALTLTFDGFTSIGARLAALRLPTVMIQEGGYNLETIGRCVGNVIAGFEGEAR